MIWNNAQNIWANVVYCYVEQKICEAWTSDEWGTNEAEVLDVVQDQNGSSEVSDAALVTVGRGVTSRLAR